VFYIPLTAFHFESALSETGCHRNNAIYAHATDALSHYGELFQALMGLLGCSINGVS